MVYDPTYSDHALEVQKVESGEEIAAFDAMGDGVNYSNGMGWQSPEGNFYGQKRVVREYEVRVVWDGINYWPCDSPYAYAGSLASLPERSEYFGQFWAVANGIDIKDVDTSTGGYWEGPWDVYYWDVDLQSWQKVDWLEKITDHRRTPYPGRKKGAGHVVIFHNVTMLWDGYKWVKAHSHSGLLNDEPEIHVPEGFVAGVTELETGHNQLVEDFLGGMSTINQLIVNTNNYVSDQIADVTAAISAMDDRIEEYASDAVITNTEANLLEVTLNQIVAESVELVSVATSLGVTDAETGYQTALTNLQVGLARWIKQNAYPISITNEERIEIQNLIFAVNNAKSKTVEAISDEQQYILRDYVKTQIAEVNSQLAAIGTSFEAISSDLSISLSEANALKAQLVSFKAESTDLLAMAAEYGLTSYGNSYQISLISLEDELAQWIDQSQYPMEITAHERGVILKLIEDVQDRKATFVAALTDSKDNRIATYVDDQISEVSASITAIGEGIDAFSSDGFITLAEANGLKQARDSLLTESDDFITVAEGLNLDTEAQIYEDAKDALISGLNQWIDNPPYPKAITSGQRSSIQSLFNALQNAKVTIVNGIVEEKTSAVAVSTNFDITQFRSVYDGFVRGFTTELILSYISDEELSLLPNYAEYDYLVVTEQNIAASKRTSVFPFTPILNWTEATQTLSTTTIQPSFNNYYVYLADRSSGFLLPNYDYRGRLFLSTTTPSSNYLGDSGLGRHAIYAGIVDTDSNSKFEHVVELSAISRVSDFKEIYRDYSDFDLVYSDENTLTLDLNYASYGQMYIPESLYYLGSGREVKTTSPRIELLPNGDLSFDYSTIAAGTLYYVYIAGDLDIYNNNSIGDDGRPLQPGAVGYNADMDFRLWLFLSQSPPDLISGRLADSYNGYWTRHVGQVLTDANGKFIYSANISAIRQKTLDAVFLDGLAEVVLHHNDNYSFYLLRKKGTSGILMVGGEGILTHELSDGVSAVHTVTINDVSQVYTESNASSPLEDGPVVHSLVGRELFVYMANSNSCWGSKASSLFVSTTQQERGYLSSNYPGNNARWVATIELTPTMIGSELVTNGDFTVSGSWTLGSGWSYNSITKRMEHSSGTASLSQSIGLTAGNYYQVRYSLVACASGNVRPALGGTLGPQNSLPGGLVSNMLAGSTGLIELVPSSDFTVSVDNISVRPITAGDFSGNYLKDGVNIESSIIEDTNVSYNTTWSSNRIQTEINNIRALITATGLFEQQKQFGIPVKLSYFSNTEVILTPTSGEPTIAFPDGSSGMLPASGITLTVSGPAYQFLYIWLLDSVDGLVLEANTDAPVITYNRLKTMGEGTTKVLVGYVGLSAASAVAGDWNVFSLYGEPQRIWTSNITTSSPTYLNLPGLVVAPNKSASAVRTGRSLCRAAYLCTGATGYAGWMEDGVVTGNFSMSFYTWKEMWNTFNIDHDSNPDTPSLYPEPGPNAEGYYYIPGSYSPALARYIRNGTTRPYYQSIANEIDSLPPFTGTVAFGPTSFSTGAHTGLISLTHSLNPWTYPSNPWGGTVTEPLHWTSVDGQIIATRQPSDW